jgi:hypothetical protein
LSKLRADAERAARAVVEEEDRQRNAYNDTLTVLQRELTAAVATLSWVVREDPQDRRFVATVAARPGWADGKDMLHVRFHYALESAAGIFEDPRATAVEVVWLPSGERCLFPQPPHLSVLDAVVRAFVKLPARP